MRIAATEKPHGDVHVTACKNAAGQLVVAAINNQMISNPHAGTYAVTDGQATACIDPGRVDTFVSQ